MTLEPGTRLGVYEISSALGAGGMGEVYRARDTRLQRDVALKIMPEAFASDPERLARFEREAQMLASLNHPHIAAIHGIEESGGVRALVLELVDGDTLAERIATAAIPVDEAIAIARQIADALEAAHEQGIIHRDLKPSNIKVRSDGTVKVLDFGLAKLAGGNPNAGPKEQGPAYTVSPTITTPAMTQIGVIMGTAAYMSPEQAKGREADKRSDVWAFGAVLYEMLTGHRAFDGDDMSDTFAGVLKIDPDWTRLPSDLPPALRTLIQRCLAKDRRQRVSDISAARFVLAELNALNAPRVTPAAHDASAPPRSRAVWIVPASIATVVTAFVVGAAAWALRSTPDVPHLVQFAFTLPEGQNFTNTGRQLFAVSPDGTKLVYVANFRLYLRTIGELEAHAIPGTETDNLGAFNPVFAPDGESIAFWSPNGPLGGVLKRIPITGGAAAILANTGPPVGASWGSDGILYGISGATGSQGQRGIARVRENGGMPERIVTVGNDESAHGPQILPDGQTVVFTLTKSTAPDRWDHAQVVAESLVDHSRRVLVEPASDARYLASGHLVYAVGGTMFAVAFDAKRLEKKGTPVPVVVGVRRASTGQSASAQLAVSSNGTVIYRPGPANISATVRGVVIGDDKGTSTPLKLPAANYAHPRVSPDGRVLAVSRDEVTTSEIWTYDLSGKAEAKRLTFEGVNRFPVWSADSRRVTFQSNRGGDVAIWWQSPDSGAAERLTKAATDEEHLPESWSPDGTRLLFTVVKGGSRTLWVLTMNGLKTARFSDAESPSPFSAGFSPDGKWIVYTRGIGPIQSPERGVFVEPYPARPGEKRQLPKTNIDYHPVWSPDGKSIFYVPSSTRPTVLVPITLTPSVSFGAPMELPKMPRPGLLLGESRGYDVLRDGRVVSLSGGTDETAQAGGADVRVMLNWFEELKRRVPVK